MKKLASNRTQFQTAIDIRFPPDKAAHLKTNAVCSHILRLGYFQAVGFLQSILPFDRMMTGAGLSSSESWNKCLTYVKAVFTRIFKVHTVSEYKSLGSMIYGMMRATYLLESYTEMGWIRHSDVSSALVVTSLQREGWGTSASTSTAQKHAIDKNKEEIGKLYRELTGLKNKNPSWNT